MKRVLSLLSLSSSFLPSKELSLLPGWFIRAFLGRIKQVAGEKSIGNWRAEARAGVFLGEGHLKNKGSGTPAENMLSGWYRSVKRNFKKYCF